MCFNEELWLFLFERFGGSIVKRFYIRSSSSIYTNVDVKMKPISIKYLSASDLRSGNLNSLNFKVWWTQIGKNATLKEVKIRVHDHLKAAGYKIEMDDVRLWLYTAKFDEEEKKDKKKDVMKQLK